MNEQIMSYHFITLFIVITSIFRLQVRVSWVSLAEGLRGNGVNCLALPFRGTKKMSMKVSLNCLLMVQYNRKLIPLLISARISIRSPRGPYTSSTKYGKSPLSRLRMPCGNSVSKNKATTTRSMRVVRCVFFSRPDSSLPERFRNFRLLASALCMVRMRRILRMVSPTHGTNLTRMA